MPCTLCHADNRAEFGTEMIIHLNGLSNAGNRGVLTFPQVSVCLSCGFSTFALKETEFLELDKGQAEFVLNGTPAKL
jgi:hypothetical protein